MQGLLREDLNRISTRSSHLDTHKIFSQGHVQRYARTLDDATRISTRSSHKDLYKIMLGPLRWLQQDLHKVFSEWPLQDHARTSFRRIFRRSFHKELCNITQGPLRGVQQELHTRSSHRRKFRSQTSDNMDRWKAEQGRGREKRKIRREKSRRERVRGKKMEMREKVGKSRFTVFFPRAPAKGSS